jgi:hypothetical protein
VSESFPQKRFVLFTDSTGEKFSLLCETHDVAIELIKQLCLATALANEKHLFWCDIETPSCGPLVASGDLIGVLYTGWLVANWRLGHQFDANTPESLFEMVVGDHKTIQGWEIALIGMRKGGRRMLVVSPELGYGIEGFGTQVPPNSTLLFDISIQQCKKVPLESPHLQSNLFAMSNEEIKQHQPQPLIQQHPFPVKSPYYSPLQTNLKQVSSKMVIDDIAQKRATEAEMRSRLAKMDQGISANWKEVGKQLESLHRTLPSSQPLSSSLSTFVEKSFHKEFSVNLTSLQKLENVLQDIKKHNALGTKKINQLIATEVAKQSQKSVSVSDLRLSFLLYLEKSEKLKAKKEEILHLQEKERKCSNTAKAFNQLKERDQQSETLQNQPKTMEGKL